MRRLSIGLLVCVGGFAVAGCPTQVRTDTGGGGIDANISSLDAFTVRNDAVSVPCETEGPEDTAAACTDGCNNDGDGFTDCDDFDCCDATTCGPDTGCGRRAMNDAGRVFRDAPVPACETTGPEDTVAACMDGCNNDGDTFADCDDFDCCDVVTCGPDTGCGRRAMRDAGPGRDAAVMVCATEAPENTATACGDGCDNDRDGFFDCGDFDCCRVISGCGPTTACGRDAGTSMPRDAGPRCDAGAGAGPEMGMAGCTDGIDNDCDGFTDCRDFGCTTEAPPDRTYCVTAPENNATACSDMMDNDLDSFIDCNDANCCGIRTVASCEAGSYIARGSCM